MNRQTEHEVPAWVLFLPLVGVLFALGAVRGWFGDAGEQTVVLLAAAPLLVFAGGGLAQRHIQLWLAWVLAGALAALTGTAIAPGTTLLLGLGADLILFAGMVAGLALLSAEADLRERWLGAALLAAVLVASSVWWAPSAPLVDGYPVAVGHGRLFAGSARAVECAALLLVLAGAIFELDSTPGWYRSAASAAALLTLGAAIDLGAGAAAAIALLALACVITGRPLASTAVAVVAGVGTTILGSALNWKLRAWTAGASALAAVQHPVGAGRGEFSAAIEPFVGRRLDVIVYETGRIFRAPENWLVGALVERGWLGLGLLTIALAAVLIVACRRDRQATLPAVAAVVLLGLASDPTWTPATALVLGMLFAIVPGVAVNGDASSSSAWRPWLRLSMVALALLCAATAWQVAGSQRLLASAALDQAANHLDLEEATLVRYADRQRRNEYAWPRLVDKRVHEDRLIEAWDAALHWRAIRPDSPRAAATATVVGVAVNAFEQAAEAVPVWHGSRGAHPLWLYRNGVIALAYAQQTTDALALAEEALSRWPDDLSLQRLRGRLLLKLAYWQEAFDVWTAIAENEQANLKDLQFLEYAAERAGFAPATAPAAASESEPRAQ